MFFQPISYRMGGGGTGYLRIEKHRLQFKCIFPAKLCFLTLDREGGGGSELY